MKTWPYQRDALDPRTEHFRFPGLNFEGAVALWAGDAEFRAFFAKILADSRFGAFFWENPPLTPESAAGEFEFVLIDGPSLASLRPQPGPFSAYFRDLDDSDQSVARFQNRGGDSTLIAPKPLADEAIYTSLAPFCRKAPATQIDELWRCVGQTLQDRRGSSSPVWLSTAGMGVSWLHIRLDPTPKYYRHAPYRRI